MKISEQTTVTIGIVIALLGGSVFISKIYFMSDATAYAVSEVKADQRKYFEDIAEIKRDVAIIKEKLIKEK